MFEFLIKLRDYSVMTVLAASEMDAHREVREFTDGEQSGDVITVERLK